MDAEQIREYVLQKKAVTEGFPFGEDTLVFKVNNKMFLLLALNETPLRLNVKCNPDRAIELREEFPDVILPGYHMNKIHWNTIILSGIKTSLLKEMIDDSYELVGKKK
jgi:predicted DNA-binding protein (MmcQ/YjbR family)